ncbi:cohesin domain-containing protein, partial [Faecalicatena contorta]
MKKAFKQIGVAILTLCLTVSCFSFVALAAEGTLQFSDPSAAAGENVTVTAKVISNAEGVAVGDTDITVTYDPSILKFVSGTNATGGDGTVKLSAKGDGTSMEVNYSMEFTALKEGTATLEAKEYTAYLANDEALNLTLGTSQVTIQGGTPVSEEEAGENEGQAGSDGLKVTVDGKEYTVNANFSEAVIPKGFTAAETELDGQKTKAMVQETSGQYIF